VAEPVTDEARRRPGGEHRLIEARLVLAVLGRPHLWGAAARLARRTAARGWWRRWPPRPVPPAAYLDFRTHTALGGAVDAKLTPAEVVAYLEWCRRMERIGVRP
jgi:hypothetical protein